MTERNLMAELRDLQRGRCGMCGERCTDLIVDHDHGSGMVRGLLCVGCNILEGSHRCHAIIPDLCRVWTWRRTPAVSWLGWTERHCTSFPTAPEPFDEGWLPSAGLVMYAEILADEQSAAIQNMYPDLPRAAS